MPQQDTSNIKQKIVDILRIRGPCLPVHIAKGIGMSILFTSAFLSELISERRIRTSDMKVGSSKLHFLEGQEPRLENFAQHLKSREKEAFELIKQKKFLEDNKQEPVMRVALRAIKDFAIPFERNGKIIWRYFTVPESEYIEIKPLPKPIIQEYQKKEKELGIFEKREIKEIPKVRQIKETPTKRKPSQKKNEKFFNQVKEYLTKRNIEIIGIEGFSKSDLLLKIRTHAKTYLLVAYNKKRIKEEDIIKANKKANELGLKYIIFSLGEPLKKLSNLLEAIKNLEGIEKLE